MPPFPEQARRGTNLLPETHFIDSLEFAKQSLEIHDKIRASRLPGLKDVLSTGDGELEYCLRSGRVGQDRPMLRLEVTGVLSVFCQRCLGEMRYPVNVAKDFVLVAEESAIPEDELDDDTVDYLVAGRKMDVLALVEEELLLSLPFVLAHESGCDGEAVSPFPQRPNPFQILEGLKKQQQD